MKSLFNNKLRFFVDVETTGFDPIRNDVVSLAMIVTDQDGGTLGTFYETCRPNFNKFYDPSAEKIHGFSREQLEKFQAPRELCKKPLWFLNDFRTPDQDELLIYHALNYFDWHFLDWIFRKSELEKSLYKMFNQNCTLSTIEISRKLGNEKNNKLNQWAERLGIELDHHNALSDTMACAKIYFHLTEGKEHEVIDPFFQYYQK
jgi:DNA polymerase-3 subunit epsilon